MLYRSTEDGRNTIFFGQEPKKKQRPTYCLPQILWSLLPQHVRTRSTHEDRAMWSNCLLSASIPNTRTPGIKFLTRKLRGNTGARATTTVIVHLPSDQWPCRGGPQGLIWDPCAKQHTVGAQQMLIKYGGCFTFIYKLRKVELSLMTCIWDKCGGKPQ